MDDLFGFDREVHLLPMCRPHPNGSPVIQVYGWSRYSTEPNPCKRVIDNFRR